MTPTDFRQANMTLTAPDGHEDCGDLRAEVDSYQIVSCWSMSWRERFSALVFGRAWLGVANCSGTQPPVWLSAERDPHKNS